MQASASRVSAPRLSGLTNWLGGSERSRGYYGYLNAVLAVVATAILRLLLEVLFAERAPTYFVFLIPVFVAALTGGVLPALFATVLSWATAHFLFVDPAFEFKTSSQDWVTAGVFLVEGAAIALIGGRLRSTFEALVEREEQLATSEARLLMAQAAARIATYDWVPATGKSEWSDNAEAIMGRRPGTFAGTLEDSMVSVFPEDRQIIDDAMERLMRDGENEAEYRVLAYDGQTRWIRATGTVVRGDDGAVERVVGVMMDISQQRRQAEHDQFLADATAELARSLDYRQNIIELTSVAVPRFSDVAAAVLVSDGQFPGQVISAVHRDPERRQALLELQESLQAAPQKPGAIAQSIRSGTPLFLSEIPRERIAEFAVSPRHERAVQSLDLSAVICVPLLARGNPLGGLIFAQEARRTFDPADFVLATELGRRAALAIENALLLEQSFDREGSASRANEALQLIADSGMVLSATLDIDETLASLAQLVVPRFADICSISLVDGDNLRRSAIEAVTPELRERMLKVSEGRGYADPELLGAATQAIRSGRPIFLPQVPSEIVTRLSTDAAVVERLREIDPQSAIIMPLSARDQTLGVMSFLRVGRRPPFDREDLSLSSQIARRTAIAADNAMLYAEARRANDAKDEFLGMMSHELRTPITVIHGGARVLRSRFDYLDLETRRGLLFDIERESERLSRMLENLLALARAELDREVVLEPVLLQRLVPRLLDSASSDASREVRFASDGELPSVAAEPGYIEHIVRNLVGNAVKYSPADTAIDVILQACGDGASVRVLDRGFGVSDEEAHRIFERFYRSDRTSRLASGAGLGLAVCKRLVEAMSGQIWATPREGGGLEVGFSLPPYNEEDLDL